MVRTFFKKLRNHKDDSGFSLAELLIAMAMAGAVAGIVSVTVASGMSASNTVGERAVNQVTVSRVFEGLIANITLANPVEQIAPDAVTLIVNRPDICERHQYRVITDEFADSSKEYSLRHIVQQAPLDPGTTCASLKPNIWVEGDYAVPVVDRIEITGLKPNENGEPIFNYYTIGGAKLNIVGSTNNPSDLALSCSVGRIEVQFTVQETRTGIAQVAKTQATPRSATLGMIC